MLRGLTMKAASARAALGAVADQPKSHLHILCAKTPVLDECTLIQKRFHSVPMPQRLNIDSDSGLATKSHGAATLLPFRPTPKEDLECAR